MSDSFFVGKNSGTVKSNSKGSKVVINGEEIIPDRNGEVHVEDGKIIKGRKKT
jgi:hypothetical protein